MKDSLITIFSAWFVKRWRVTLLLLLGIFVFGAASYTTLLKREGFPPIAVPIIWGTAPYQANDAEVVKTEVTNPIEQAAKSVAEVKSIRTTTTDNFATFIIELEQDADAEVALRDIQAAIDREVLPPDVNPSLSTINAGSYDGTNDLIFSIYNKDVELAELQTKAEELAEKLTSLDEIRAANVTKSIETGINPFTGQEVSVERAFNRVGVREFNQVKTYDSIAMGVVARNDVGVIELSEAVRAAIDENLTKDEFAGYQVAYTADFSKTVTNDIDNLENNLLLGLLAVLAIVYLLVSFRSALITVLFIPLVLAASFASLWLIGYTLNTLTLFATILVLGLIVDDAIVVTEAIEQQRRKGIKGLKAVKNAINEIGVADLSGTLTTVLVFAPMAFISGILGQFIIIVPITVIVALVNSLLIALTIVPLFSSWLLPAADPDRKVGSFKRFLNALEQGLSPIVDWIAQVLAKFSRWYLKSFWRTLGVIVMSLVLMGAGYSFASQLEFTIFPAPSDADQLLIQLSFEDGTGIDQAKDYAETLENRIKAAAPEAVEQIAYFGADQSQATVQVTFLPDFERPPAGEIAERIQSSIDSLNGIDGTVTVAGPGPPTSNFNLTAEVYSDDQATLESATKEIEDFVSGLKSEDVSVTETQIGNLETIARIDGKRAAEVRAKISDPTNTAALVDLTNQINDHYTASRLDDLGLEDDAVSIDLGQESDNLQSFESAAVALGAAILLLYALLVIEFNSFFTPFLILLAVPFGMAGVVPGLALTENPLSFFVMIGVIALAGITVNNSIMLIEITNQLRAQGEPPSKAISEALRTRFRPIAATTVTTVIALIPLALSDPFWESLSYTLIFGLIASAILVSISFPAYYGILEKLRSLGRRLLGRKS